MSNLNTIQQSAQTVQSDATNRALEFYANGATCLKSFYKQHEIFQLTCQLVAIAVLLVGEIGKLVVKIVGRVWVWGLPMLRSAWSNPIVKEKREMLILHAYRYIQGYRQQLKSSKTHLMLVLSPFLQRLQSTIVSTPDGRNLAQPSKRSDRKCLK